MTALTMTKLVVADLEREKAFYEAVCGLKEARRINGALDGRPITELIMASDESRGGTLVLFRFHDAPTPPTDECMLVFETSDITALLRRAELAGGTVTQPIEALPDFGLSFAFVRDPEGHIVEVLQRTT
jgi:predicted enzyme related to lactoylglutathione lyase